MCDDKLMNHMVLGLSLCMVTNLSHMVPGLGLCVTRTAAS